MNVAEAATNLLGLVFSPGRTLDRVAARPAVATATLPLAATGAAWSLLSLLLWHGRHAPSQTLLPVPKPSYYLAQALWVVPMLFLGWAILVAVAHRLAAWAGGRGERAGMRATLAYAYAAPIAGLVVLPDLVIHLAFGFDALRVLVKVSGPLVLLAECALCTRAVMAVHGLGVPRALAVALAALLAQGLIVGSVLR